MRVLIETQPPDVVNAASSDAAASKCRAERNDRPQLSQLSTFRNHYFSQRRQTNIAAQLPFYLLV